jgi:hypothetical protein
MISQKPRDYAREHELRKKRTRRIHADLDKNKVEEFKNHLEARGLTFVRWLDDKMNEELKA